MPMINPTDATPYMRGYLDSHLLIAVMARETAKAMEPGLGKDALMAFEKTLRDHAANIQDGWPESRKREKA